MESRISLRPVVECNIILKLNLYLLNILPKVCNANGKTYNSSVNLNQEF
jgi:hypothetical protein